MSSGVRVDIEDGRAAITLDLPSTRNALSSALLGDLHAALDAVDADQTVRVVVLGHAGPVFCAGADLKEWAAGTASMAPLADVLTRIEHLPAPVIAAVNGPVRAGGIGLMAACDLVVVNRAVTFAFTEVRLGLAPAIISVPILARCGWSALAAPFLTGEEFTAESALSIGLVTHVSDDVSTTVDTLCEAIRAAAPNAVAATKQLLRRPGTMAEMSALSAALGASAEGREGMASFIEKRPPRWVTGGQR